MEDLCPGNAPRRCAECKGPYHIRKRCPKVISLANEKEKLKRTTIPEQQQPPPSMIPNHHQFYPNPSHYYYPPPSSHINHGYSYPYEMISQQQQRIWAQPYSNDGSRMYPMVNYYPYDQQMNNSNRSFYSNNQRTKQCYGCGSINHLRAQCPQFPPNTLQR